jgi:hypothetical protein
MCKKLIILCVALVVVGLSMPALAAAGKITYRDCYDSTGQVGNTTMLDGSPWTATPTNSGTDGLWRRRVSAVFGQPNPLGEGDVYEANGGFDADTEDVHMLKTTLTIPSGPEFQGCGSDKVHVLAFIWVDGSQWRIRAQMNGTPSNNHMPLYYCHTTSQIVPPTDVETEPFGPNYGQAVLTTADGSEFKPGTIVGTRLGGRFMYICDLGCAALGETVTIYVDGDGAIDRTKLASTWNARTWFDGVGYTPEPATIALLGLGGLALLRRKHA